MAAASAHSKFFMFSHAGKARKVVIQGSANYTVASTTNQWNDIYTHRGNRKVWDFANRIFKEAAADKRARRPYADREFGAFRLLMFPNTGRRVADPVMQMLNRVRCQGATNTASGRTRIRIAPDVIRNPRGMKLGRKVRALWRNGCDIRVGYTVIGRDVGRMMRAPSRRGPVPLKHLVQDFNGDGEFDNYFHMKSMTIVGNYGGDRSNHVLLNGSSNWSGLGKISDENLGIYRSKGLVQRYQKHLIYWYKNFPGSALHPADHAAVRPARAGGPADLRQRRQRRLRGRHAGGLRPVRQHAVGLTGGQTSDPRPQARRPGHPAAGPGGPSARRVRRRAPGLDVLDTA